jgi:hypothetical protein
MEYDNSEEVNDASEALRGPRFSASLINVSRTGKLASRRHGGNTCQMFGAESTSWTITPLKGVSLQTQSDINLGDGFALSRCDDCLLAAREPQLIAPVQFREIEAADWFLVLRTPQNAFQSADQLTCVERLMDALITFQVIKPIETYGFIFSGIQLEGMNVQWQGTNIRWPMSSGRWSQLRAFDEPLLHEAKSLMSRVKAAFDGTRVAPKNALHLLQLALEHPHPYVACLLAVTGMEAVLDSRNRWDFESKLCDRLGSSTLAFPDWNSPGHGPLKYAVGDLAVHLYTLRSKVAHGQDLTKAASDKHSPIDLLASREYLAEGDPVRYAQILCESSIYLLGRLLKEIL